MPENAICPCCGALVQRCPMCGTYFEWYSNKVKSSRYGGVECATCGEYLGLPPIREEPD